MGYGYCTQYPVWVLHSTRLVLHSTGDSTHGYCRFWVLHSTYKTWVLHSFYGYCTVPIHSTGTAQYPLQYHKCMGTAQYRPVLHTVPCSTHGYCRLHSTRGYCTVPARVAKGPTR